LTKVDLSIGTKRTPRQDVKSNAAQDDEQHNITLRRRNHKIHKRKNFGIFENHLFRSKKKKKKM